MAAFLDITNHNCEGNTNDCGEDGITQYFFFIQPKKKKGRND